MTTQLAAIREWRDVSKKTLLNEIIPGGRPAVLRGFVDAWPAVRHAKISAAAISTYLKKLDTGKPVDAILTPPEVRGRIFYNENLDGFNFLRNQVSVSSVVDQALRYAQFATAPSVAIQSAMITECMPRFIDEHALPFMDRQILPRLWLGNAITTPAHIDTSYNIACVVSGKRRFTLFPPDQVANLYIGPLDFAPTNSPISMVSFTQPDFVRHPKFKDALTQAQFAELQPGDAIFIPTLWWHHVESLNAFNVLVNYWWTNAVAPAQASTPFECLLHCLNNFKHLPPDQREAWGALFKHYVFDGSADPAIHLPANRRGVLAGRSA
ncbi:cupin-like domain-containing protein [Undibacterium sp. Rencai35W]|uniref:cupin-like domain-containing protein n=1 Tax=Undibacterium sp. Rencai35W TaxID=3413046 RepID=UPI003BF2A5BE